MRHFPLDPVLSSKLELRCQRLRAEKGLTTEEVVTLNARARRILEGRIHPAISPYDRSISHENCSEGIGPILDATIWQACLDAARITDIHRPSRN